MKKRTALIMILCLLLLTVSSVHAEKKTADTLDEATKEKMATLNACMAEIGRLPAVIDSDICGQKWDQYKADMNLLAQNIMKANEAIKDVQLYYPLDLWYIYNTISANPYCGISKRVTKIYDVAQTSVSSSEEKMGIGSDENLCMCWNIITGREEPTGYWKDGACRCYIGTNNHSPQIGLNDVDWVTGEPLE